MFQFLDVAYIEVRLEPLQQQAYKVYGWLQEGIHPEDAAVSAVGLFPDTVDVGIIILNTQGYGAKSKNKMAWSMMQEKQT